MLTMGRDPHKLENLLFQLVLCHQEIQHCLSLLWNLTCRLHVIVYRFGIGDDHSFNADFFLSSSLE